MSLSWLFATPAPPYPCGAARATEGPETRVESATPPTQRDAGSLPALSHGKAGTGFIGRFFRLAFGWRAHIRDRRHLFELSDYLLHDIGISRAEIEDEPSRAFWRVER